MPVLDRRSSKGSKETLIYSPREEETMREVFSLLINKEDVLRELENILNEKENMEEFCSSLFNMSRATGQTFQMIRFFVQEEFKKNTAATEGSLMRGSTIASRLTKEITNKMGRKYLQNLLGAFVHKTVVTEHKISFEIDPSKCETSDEITTNKARLLENVRNMVEVITSQHSIDTMPPEIRVIAGYFAEFAKIYSPKQLWPIVGGFVLLRYINPAIMTPEAYSLLPDGKIPANIPRRNLILVSKILQNLANGVEFGKKEQYMMSVNDFIKENKVKMEKYLENIINFTVKSNLADPTAIDVEDLHLLHRVLTQSEDRILVLFKEKEEAKQFSKLLASLGSYQSKISFSFLPINDRKSVMSLLEQKGEEASFIGVVDKTKYGKFQKRTLMIGENRIASFKPGGKLAREAHLLDLIEIKSPTPTELQLIFQNFAIVCNTEESNNIISCILRAFNRNFSYMPKVLHPKLTLDDPSRIKVQFEPVNEPCGGFVGTYKSLCNFYNVKPNFDVFWHFSNLPSRIRTVDLKRFMKSYSEEALTSDDLGPLFWSLRFNIYFENFIIKNYKLDKDSFLDLVEMLKFNSTLTSLVLKNVNGTKESFLTLFEALIFNKSCLITSLDVSDNDIEDKAIISLGNFIINSCQSLCSLNISNTSIGKDAIVGLSHSLTERMKTKVVSSSLHFLSVSDNKLGKATESLTNMIILAGSTLKTLHVANTGCNLQLLLECLKKGCPVISNLDISRNRMKTSDGKALIEFLETASNLTELNMASNKCPLECLRDILTSVSKDTYLKLDLSDNSLGVPAANIIGSIPFKMSNIHTLNLSDNDFGEEGISMISEGLCSNTTLKTLVLDRNFKSGKSRKEAIDNLIKLIESTTTLEGLSLVGGGGKNERLKQELIPFLSCLGSNKSLISLDIRSQSFGNKGAIALSKGLRKNHTISSLLIDDNLTGLLGFINVKNAVKLNITLKNMPLPISDIGFALKNESANAKEIYHTLNKIEKRILRNQQYH